MIYPFPTGNAVFDFLQAYLIGRSAAVTVAIAVEGQSHHQFVARYTGLQVFLNALMRYLPGISDGAAPIECRMMIGWRGHVVGHHIDKVQILDAMLVVIIVRTR